MTRAYLKKILIKEQKKGGKESKNEKKTTKIWLNQTVKRILQNEIENFIK